MEEFNSGFLNKNFKWIQIHFYQQNHIKKLLFLISLFVSEVSKFFFEFA